MPENPCLEMQCYQALRPGVGLKLFEALTGPVTLRLKIAQQPVVWPLSPKALNYEPLEPTRRRQSSSFFGLPDYRILHMNPFESLEPKGYRTPLKEPYRTLLDPLKYMSP